MPIERNGFQIGLSSELPQPRQMKPRRGARRKYPWWELEPGQWFAFAAEVTEQAARTQGSNMSASCGREFKVYPNAESRLICVRVDGLPRNQWPDIPRAERNPYTPPEPAESAPDAVEPLADTFENAPGHDFGGGAPMTFGQDNTMEDYGRDERGRPLPPPRREDEV